MYLDDNVRLTIDGELSGGRTNRDGGYYGLIIIVIGRVILTTTDRPNID